MGRRKDIWRCAIVDRPLPQVLLHGLDDAPIRWFAEEPRLTYLADPFGVEIDGRRFVFVEQYDYRTGHGRIEVLTLDANDAVIDRHICLREPWHLSYPQVFLADGAFWMLPEAHKSGGLTLYKALDFPTRWAAAAHIVLDQIPVDATLLRHGGLWWLFYASAETKQARFTHLLAAWAEQLTGPWTPHAKNPLRIDAAAARPGGTAISCGETAILPVQDCSRGYGIGLTALHIDRIDPDQFETHRGRTLTAPDRFAPYADGLHTATAFGARTLIDAKMTTMGWRNLISDVQRIVRIRRGRR
jgi:hypothetical protein